MQCPDYFTSLLWTITHIFILMIPWSMAVESAAFPPCTAANVAFHCFLCNGINLGAAAVNFGFGKLLCRANKAIEPDRLSTRSDGPVRNNIICLHIPGPRH